MLQVQDGQCGMCAHFGEHHQQDPQLVQIRSKHQAPEQLVEECCHPNNEKLHLMVTAVSGCDGFTPAQQSVQ